MVSPVTRLASSWQRRLLLSLASVALLSTTDGLLGKGKPPKDPPPPAPLPEYSYQSLGTLGGSWSQANGMNDLGHVVGQSERADGSTGPYVYTPQDGMQDLTVVIPNSEVGLISPKQLVLGPDGLLYVSSSGTDEVLAYDATTGQLLSVFVTSGSGGLDHPYGLAFELNGDLLVTSRNTDEVLSYDGLTGAFAGVFIAANSGGLDDPVNLTYGPDFNIDGAADVYVTSRATHEILVYDGTDGAFLDVFVSAGSGGLDVPFALEFGPDGDLYVVSRESDSVLRYDGLSGAPLEIFAGVGSGNVADPLDGPTDLTFGPEGDLYVASNINHHVLRYDGTTGTFLDEFVPSRSGRLAAPMDVQFDLGGNLLVTSRDTHQILVFQGPASAGPGDLLGELEAGDAFIVREAHDINNAGQIVGQAMVSGIGNVPFRYTPPASGETVGIIDTITGPDLLATNGVGWGWPANTHINNDGDVAGNYISASDDWPFNWHVFYWTAEDGFHDLGNLGGDLTYASAINDRDANGDFQIVGSGEGIQPGLQYRAWRYDTATGVVKLLDPLNNDRKGKIVTKLSFGMDINNAGDITGSSTPSGNSSGDRHGYLYTDSSGMQDLGTLGGRCAGHGINDFGDVVGGTEVGAFLYTVETGMIPLEPQIIDLPPALGGTIDAGRINLAGQICGPRDRNAGEAFLLTPQPK